MAKSASPVRRQDALSWARQHRSAAQQVEYWVALGQQVATLLDRERLPDMQSAVTHLRVDPVRGVAVSAEAVFEALENQRRNGSLAGALSSAALRYQACPSHPALLEGIDGDERRTIGRFSDGVFCPAGPALRERRRAGQDRLCRHT